MKYKMVIFDLDGTILNTISDLNSAVNYGLSLVGLDSITVEKTKEYIGDGIRCLMERASNYSSDIDLLLDGFNRYYNEHFNDLTLPYDGIEEIIQYCHKNNILLGVITNKVENIARLLCDYHFKDDLIFVYGDTKERKRKPNPETLNYVIEKYNLNTSEVLFVGDTEVDVYTAKNAGVDVVLCNYGYRKKSRLLELFADEKMVDKAIEILNYL